MIDSTLASITCRSRRFSAGANIFACWQDLFWWPRNCRHHVEIDVFTCIFYLRNHEKPCKSHEKSHENPSKTGRKGRKAMETPCFTSRTLAKTPSCGPSSSRGSANPRSPPTCWRPTRRGPSPRPGQPSRGRRCPSTSSGRDASRFSKGIPHHIYIYIYLYHIIHIIYNYI